VNCKTNGRAAVFGPAAERLTALTINLAALAKQKPRLGIEIGGLKAAAALRCSAKRSGRSRRGVDPDQ
jgi:hypothetical protein